ncbi:MAG: type III pantothenate kinase [Lentisphaeria bacterium]|nr:type III pantothenate kinase [Lentisphaeria bacterium]
MMKELLIINAGNTHIETVLLPLSASFDWKDFPEEKRKILSREELPDFLKKCPDNIPLAASSVVPELTELLIDSGAFVVNKNKRFPFDTSRMDISTVGADRLANAAALTGGKLPAICIDFGTAITFETVEADIAFTGGAILPGRKLMRQALHDHTALLPLLPLTDTPSRLPAAAGKNTKEAMLLGTDLACIGGVKEVLERIKGELEKKYPGQKIRICACGGDRKFFLKAMPFLEETPFLTLEGIARIWQANQEEISSGEAKE